MGQKKLGISLRGGGASCASYVGVFKALEEHEIEPHVMVGASAGAIFGVSYALGAPLPKIADHFRNFLKFVHPGPKAVKERAVWSEEILQAYTDKLLGKDARVENARIPIHVQATNIKTGDEEILSEGEAAKLLVATAAIPMLVHPVELAGRRYIDGDLIAGYASSFLRNEGAEVVIGLNTQKLNRQFDDSHHIDDILNMVSHKLRKQDLTIDPVDMLLDGLAEELGVVNFKATDTNVQSGYEKTLAQMPTIKKLLWRRSIWNLFA